MIILVKVKVVKIKFFRSDHILKAELHLDDETIYEVHNSQVLNLLFSLVEDDTHRSGDALDFIVSKNEFEPIGLDKGMLQSIINASDLAFEKDKNNNCVSAKSRLLE